MIITFCNQKGGSGKTTLSILMALALENVGKHVAIIDRDPQQTSARAIQHLQNIQASAVEIANSPEGYEAVFIDTPPSLSKPLATAIQQSDCVVLVSSPSPADLWSTQDSCDFVKGHISKNVPCRLLFNNVLQAARIARDLPALAKQIGLKPLNNSIARRQAYQYAILQGWSALKPAECDEIRKAALEIVTL